MAVPDEKKMATIWRCDYCRVRKPGRREVFVFGNSGQEIVVGSCCVNALADRIGYLSPAALVWTAEVMNALNLRRFEDAGVDAPFFEDEFVPVASMFGVREVLGFIDIEDAVAAAACSIRHFGWSGETSCREHDVGYRATKIREGSKCLNLNRNSCIVSKKHCVMVRLISW